MDGFGMGFGGGFMWLIWIVLILAVAWALGGLRTWREPGEKARANCSISASPEARLTRKSTANAGVLWIASHGVGALSWPSTLRRTVCGFSFLTRFGRRPVHMNTTSKDSGDMSTIVERVFQVTVPDALELPDFVPYLTAKQGILDVVPDTVQRSVRVRYDVRHVDFAGVQAMLNQAGAALPEGLWQRLRTEWLVNLDNNLRDNASSHPACCSRPPAGAGGHRPRGTA